MSSKGKRFQSKGPSQRQLRVGEQIRHALADVFSKREIVDPFFEKVMVTVSEVRCSPDLKNATAFVAPLGGGDTKDLLEALKRVKPFLRRKVASEVVLKYAPNLSFQADGSFDEAAKINDLLNNPKVQRDLAQDHMDDSE